MLSTATQPPRFQCRHIFTDGRRCLAPGLRSPAGPEEFCYYHHTTRGAAARRQSARRASSRSAFDLALPEDRSAIQLTLGEVLRRIASNEIDPRRAGLLLYGLQIASLNLPRHDPATPPAKSPTAIDEVTLDPTFGPLAPPADYTENQQPKGSAVRLLEELQRNEHLWQEDALKRREERRHTEELKRQQNLERSLLADPGQAPEAPMCLPSLRAEAHVEPRSRTAPRLRSGLRHRTQPSTQPTAQLHAQPTAQLTAQSSNPQSSEPIPSSPNLSPILRRLCTPSGGWGPTRSPPSCLTPNPRPNARRLY